ncbi:MAG TPA: DUF6452 family protein [Chryseolinea sp.]|nr:DUF6452 family protein [Chryseolinea sp.]
MKKTGLFTFVLIIVVSCLNEPDCYQLNNDAVVIDFKIIGGGSDVVQLTSIQSPEAVVIFSDTASRIVLPLNPKKEETLYTLHGPQVDNMVQFGYKRQVQFVSEECGERYYFQDLNVLEHDFDSVRIVNAIPAPTPLPSDAKNIEIYRCPTTNLMYVSFNAETVVEGITSDYAGIILPSPGATLKDFLLPLNTASDSSTYQFMLGDSLRTLRVRYSRAKKTIADICGEQTFLFDLNADTTVTDLTVAIVQDSIHDLPIRNLDITP